MQAPTNPGMETNNRYEILSDSAKSEDQLEHLKGKNRAPKSENQHKYCGTVLGYFTLSYYTLGYFTLGYFTLGYFTLSYFRLGSFIFGSFTLGYFTLGYFIFGHFTSGSFTSVGHLTTR